MERIEERLTYLEDHVKNLEEYIQYFLQELIGPECPDRHFDNHQALCKQTHSLKTDIDDLKSRLSSLESLTLHLRQSIIKLHSDDSVHPLIK